MRDYSGIRRVLIATMLLNWLATAAKLYVGFRSGTLSLSADGIDSFFDGFSNVAGLVALSLAAQPPDREHPYGHRKYETLVAVGIAVLLGIITWELVREAISRLRQPASPVVSAWSFAALVFSIILQGAAGFYEYRAGHRLKSELLIADARHSYGSIAVSLAVLVGLPFVQRGHLWVDPALTLAVSVVIARLGWDILRDSLPVLLDRAPVNPDEIAAIVDDVAGVTSYHRIRSRGAADEATVDLHVRVEPDLPMARADAIADEVRQRLLAEVSGVSDVTVHVEPQRHEHGGASQIYAAILNAAAARPVTVHEVWAYQDELGRTSAEAHIGVPPDWTLAEADTVVGQMETDILVQVPWLSDLHTHIEPAFRDLVPGEVVPPGEAWPLRTAVRAALAAIPELQGPDNVVVHRTREGLFLALDCEAEPSISVSASHALAHAAVKGIRERLPDVVDVAVRVKPATGMGQAAPGGPAPLPIE